VATTCSRRISGNLDLVGCVPRVRSFGHPREEFDHPLRASLEREPAEEDLTTVLTETASTLGVIEERSDRLRERRR
jgi:hypothetical protein